MQKIVINGANGYVASHFISELLKLNYEVISLVRNGHESSSEERMKDVLIQINNNEKKDFKNLKVYDYSLQDENLGLPKKTLKEIFDRKTCYFHFAACLKYNARDKEEIFDTNVKGVENSVNTFLEHSKPGSRFFLISSVYSCGKSTELFKEKFYDNEDIEAFRNYYEQSKRFAENIIREKLEKNKLRGHIIRLSQVVGNNKTGTILTDYGIFDFIKRIQKISEKHPDQTIRVKVDPDGTQNLISIDNTVNYLLKVLHMNEIPVLVNVIGKKSVTNDTIVAGLRDLLPVNLVQEKGLRREDLNSLERIVAAGMAFTGLYANTKLHFDSTNLDRYFSPNGNEVTADSLYRMMSNFVGNNASNAGKAVLNSQAKRG